MTNGANKRAKTGEYTGTYKSIIAELDMSKKLKVRGGLNKKVPTLSPASWQEPKDADNAELCAEKAKLNFIKQMNGEREKGRLANIIMAFKENNWKPLRLDYLKKEVCDGSDPMRDFDRNDYEKNRYHIMKNKNGECEITRLGIECWECWWENNKPN